MDAPLANMRENGVRSLSGTCQLCRHEALSAARRRGALGHAYWRIGFGRPQAVPIGDHDHCRVPVGRAHSVNRGDRYRVLMSGAL